MYTSCPTIRSKRTDGVMCICAQGGTTKPCLARVCQCGSLQPASHYCILRAADRPGDLGFIAEWVGGDVSTKLGLSSSIEKSVAKAFYRQIFFSVTMDTPSSPAAAFADAATGLTWDPWGDAINITENGPTNRTYRIYDTTLDRKYEIND